MTFAIIVLTCSWIFIVLNKSKNKYTWILGVMISGINMIIFSLLKVAAKIGNYIAPLATSLFFYDYRLYSQLSRIAIGYQKIYTIGNIGVALFLYATVLMGAIYLGGIKGWLFRQLLVATVGCAVFPLFYLCVFSTRSLYEIYFQYFALKKLSYQLILLGNVLMNGVLILYLLLPLYLLLCSYRATCSYYKKKQTVVLTVSLLTLEAIFVLIYFEGPTARFFSNDASLQAVLLNQAWRHANPILFYKVLPFVIVFAVILLLLSLLHLGGLDSITSRIPRRLLRENQRYSANLCGVFHSFKNTFFSYFAILDDMKDYADSPEILVLIEKLETINNENLNSVSRALSSMRVPNQRQQVTDVNRALDTALEKCELGTAIRVIRSTRALSCKIVFSEYQFIEILTNLLQNAKEAIIAAKREVGEISIDVMTEDSVAIVRISDNGTGILKKDRKHIFESFYSTKKIGKNWGLGLNFAAMALTTHGGLINVYTKPGVGTTFELLMRTPKQMKRRKILDAGANQSYHS
jgi:signal transduction histidine kinase